MPVTYQSPHVLGSTQRACAIIRALGRSAHPLTTTDIARAVGCDYDRAYRTLITLEGEGVVARTDAYNRYWVLCDGVALPPHRKEDVDV